MKAVPIIEPAGLISSFFLQHLIIWKPDHHSIKLTAFKFRTNSKKEIRLTEFHSQLLEFDIARGHWVKSLRIKFLLFLYCFFSIIKVIHAYYQNSAKVKRKTQWLFAFWYIFLVSSFCVPFCHFYFIF